MYSRRCRKLVASFLLLDNARPRNRLRTNSNLIAYNRYSNDGDDDDGTETTRRRGVAPQRVDIHARNSQ